MVVRILALLRMRRLFHFGYGWLDTFSSEYDVGVRMFFHLIHIECYIIGK